MWNYFLQTQLPAAIDSLDLKKTTVEIAEKLQSTPVDQLLSEFIDKAVSFGLKVLAALVIYAVGAWIIKKIKKILHNLFHKRNTDAAISSFVESLVSITLTVLLIIITVGALGINTTSLAALLAAGGMAIGMALSGTVQNFAGGIMLLVFKPFKAGDLIEANGFMGTVTEVNIVSTKLTTADNRVIIIPNGTLSNGTVNNYSQREFRRVDWTVDVEYGASVEETKAVISSVLEADKRVLHAPEAPADPFIALSSLRDSSIQFVVRAWVRSGDYWGVNFDFNENIYKALPEKGINFPFPQMDVHVTKQN